MGLDHADALTAVNTASKAAVNFGSRSRTKNRTARQIGGPIGLAALIAVAGEVSAHAAQDANALNRIVHGHKAALIAAASVTLVVALLALRSMLGIGAAWNADESAGLGLAFPPTAERFERPEEALQIILQMWTADDGPYQGKHYQLARIVNSPQVLSKPHSPVLIGRRPRGGGRPASSPCPIGAPAP
jgi:alkanesulfonate monooxygenase SsuD/methylene tetrahydromethanopterin reductase-like flavin-dependent oxidoreductase (luciferase family)